MKFVDLTAIDLRSEHEVNAALTAHQEEQMDDLEMPRAPVTTIINY
jgi:hypothetical protein